MVWLFVLKHWKPLAILLVLLTAFGFVYHKGKQHAQDEAEKAALQAQLAQSQAALQAAQAAAEAAQAARKRNDVEIPKARRESAARIERAASADAPARVRDIREAIEGYRAAASQL